MKRNVLYTILLFFMSVSASALRAQDLRGVVRELCRYPEIERIDLVEIDEEVIETSKKFL